MITHYNLDQGTFILPIVEEDNDIWTRLINDLGAYTLLEIDYETKTHTKVDIDYSLHDFKNLKYAKAELDAVYKYVKKYFGITGKVDEAIWHKENKEFLAEHKQQQIQWYSDCLQKTLDEGIDATYQNSSWFDTATIDSDPNIVKGMPPKQNNKGEYWAIKTNRKYKSQQEFDDKINEYKNKLKELEEA